MEMSGEQRIPASRDVVWRALNDPEILKACIPGCQELVKTSDTEMAATVVLKVGPVSARFRGAVTLSDLDPPNGCRITGEGQGGVAGFAKGEAVVRLETDGADTLVRYQATADVGGKLAQLGARLIDATARQMSGAFFKRFAQEIAAGASGQGRPQADAPTAGARGAPLPSLNGAAQSHAGAAAPATARPGFPVVALQLMAAGIAGYAGGLLGAGGTLPFAGADGAAAFAGAVMLVLAAGVGYLFGRLRGECP